MPQTEAVPPWVGAEGVKLGTPKEGAPRKLSSGEMLGTGLGVSLLPLSLTGQTTGCGQPASMCLEDTWPLAGGCLYLDPNAQPASDNWKHDY